MSTEIVKPLWLEEEEIEQQELRHMLDLHEELNEQEARDMANLRMLLSESGLRSSRRK